MKQSDILQTILAVLELPDGHHQVRTLLTQVRDQIERDLEVERQIMRDNAARGVARRRAAGLPIGGSRESLAKGLETRASKSKELQIRVRTALTESLDCGASYEDMAQYLNRLGIRTSYEREWTRENLAQFLSRGKHRVT